MLGQCVSQNFAYCIGHGIRVGSIFLYLPAVSAATQPGFWLLFRQSMGPTQPSAAGGKKKQPKKWLHCAAIWLHVCSHTCSQMAAQMQPNGCMSAAKTYLFAADECSHLAACMQPFVTTKPRDIRQLASECSQIMAGVYYVVTLAT